MHVYGDSARRSRFSPFEPHRVVLFSDVKRSFSQAVSTTHTLFTLGHMFTARRTLSREILKRICAYCDRHTLAVLARQGKLLSDIALGGLWSNILGIESLLHVVPLDSWTSEENSMIERKIVVCAPNIVYFPNRHLTNCVHS